MRIGFAFNANATRELVQAECDRYFRYIYGVNSVSIAEKWTGMGVPKMRRFQVNIDIEEGRHSALDQLKNAIAGYGTASITDLVWVV